MKILLIAGHGDGDPGAGGNGFYEADLTREVVTLLAPKLGEICDVTVADKNRNWYEYLGKHSYNFKDYDYVLEVHFNSGGGTGSEIFVTTSESDTGVEAAIMRQLCAAADYRNRGVKRTNFRVISRVKSQGVSSALLEVCFIDSAADIHTYTHKKNELIDAIVNGIAEGFGLKRNAPARHWAAIAHDKLNERGSIRADVWEAYDYDIPVQHALALLDAVSGGRWASEEADESIHEAQPIVISLCGKGIINEPEQWISALKANENLSKALTLALFDNMTGGMRPAYVNRDTDHWGRNCLDSLCDKVIIKTPHAWDDDFNAATTRALFMALVCAVLGI